MNECNRMRACKECGKETENPSGFCCLPCAAKRAERNERARMNRAARREVFKACGLVRGRDSMGREIWE